MSDPTYFQDSMFEARWPRELIAAEIDRLLRQGPVDAGPAHGEVYWFLSEAFSEQVADEFTRVYAFDAFDGYGDPARTREWLQNLRSALPGVPQAQPRPPYWSQRRSASAGPAKLTAAETAQEFAKLVEELIQGGYLSEAFGEECVDGGEPGRVGDPGKAISDQLGREGLWPVADHVGAYELDDLCDMIEFLFDQVSRPLVRTYHDFSGCGWHTVGGYHRDRGRQFYRWKINTLLGRSEVNLTLSADGRLERQSPEAMEGLVSAARNVVGATHPSDEAEMASAIARFRSRNADLGDRKSAVVDLAGILERRRPAVEAALLGKDEAALFQIANKFGLRHKDASQQTYYDEDLYLEWIFYMYVAALLLTDRIAERAKGLPTTNP